MSRRLPTVAERLFALLCGEAEVTCNRSSDEDNAGWDYVLHFLHDPNDARPKDEQPGAETAFVQVKSTESAPLSVKLKLSNALRMAKESHPYFIVLVVGSGSRRLIYARHFWVKEIENTLRRVREAEVTGHRDRLHRRTFTLRLTEADDHTDDLLPWMHTTIRAVRGDYRAAKTTITNSVGYQNGAMRCSVTLAGSPDEIIDWELGLRPAPPVSSLALARKRFGIELPERIFNSAAYKFSIKPTGQACLLMLRHRFEHSTVTMAGQLYWSQFATAQQGPSPWRVDSGWLTLTWRSGELRGGLKLDHDEQVSLSLLFDRLTIGGWSGDGVVTATMFTDGSRVELGLLDLPAPHEGDDGWKEVGSWVKTLQILVEAQPGVDPKLSFNDLLNPGVGLKRFHGIFSGASMRIEHTPNEDDDPTHAIIYRLRCDVGAWCFFAFVKREVAVDSVIDGVRTLYLKPGELLESHVLPGLWSENIEKIRPAYEQQIRRMGDPTYFWDVGDIEDWMAASINADRLG